MPSKEVVVLGSDDKEIVDFLERARAGNGLRVQIGPEIFVVKVASETVRSAARDFLTKGGRVAE